MWSRSPWEASWPSAWRSAIRRGFAGWFSSPPRGGWIRASWATDWRPPYRREYPRAAAWVTEEHVDHTDAIPDITAPTLLVWGARDPLSPVAVGHRLRERLPHAELHVIDDGTHSLAYDQPVTVAALIAAHLQ